MWYVIQTIAGREEAVRAEAAVLIPEAQFKVIYRVGRYNYNGEWVCRNKVMFNGYLFAITDNIEAVLMNIRKISGFAKPVRLGEEYLPISGEEQAFLERLIGDDETVDESIGIIEGDEVVVSEGPLKGLESRIIRVDRHKRLAYIEFTMGSRTVEAQLCLNILEKKTGDLEISED